MATVVGRKVPTGFRKMDEGENNCQITKVEGKPRANVTNVAVEFVNDEGVKLKNNYDLTSDGGYAAFYFLVKNGIGVDLGEGDAFDIDDLFGRFVLLKIIHKEGDTPNSDGTPKIFANIKETIGAGTPFGEAPAAAAPVAEDDEDFS